MSSLAMDLELGVAELRRKLADTPAVAETHARRSELLAEIGQLEERRARAWAAEAAVGGAASSPSVAVLLEQQRRLDEDGVAVWRLQEDEHGEPEHVLVSGLPLAELAERKQEIANEIAAVRERERAEAVAARQLAADEDEAEYDELAVDEELVVGDIAKLEAERPGLALDALGEGDDAERAQAVLEDVDTDLTKYRRRLELIQIARVERDRREQAAVAATAAAERAVRETARDAAAAEFEKAFRTWRSGLVMLQGETRELLAAHAAAEAAAAAAGATVRQRRDSRFAKLTLIAMVDAGLHPDDLDRIPYESERRSLLDAYPLEVEAASHETSETPGRRSCRVCESDDATRASIEEALAAKVSLTAIADQCGISRATLSRHHRECGAAFTEASEPA